MMWSEYNATPIVSHHNMASVHPSICLWVHDKHPGFCASKHLPMGPRQASWLLCFQAFAYGSTTSSLASVHPSICLWVHDKQPGFCASKHLPMGPRQASWLLCFQAFAYGSTTSRQVFIVQGLQDIFNRP